MKTVYALFFYDDKKEDTFFYGEFETEEQAKETGANVKTSTGSSLVFVATVEKKRKNSVFRKIVKI